MVGDAAAWREEAFVAGPRSEPDLDWSYVAVAVAEPSGLAEVWVDVPDVVNRLATDLLILPGRQQSAVSLPALGQEVRSSFGRMPPP